MDEPPQAMETAWVQRRCKCYAALEPLEAPRDEAPFVPRDAPLTLRLEDEASERMWRLLLESDNMEEERVKILYSGVADAKEQTTEETVAQAKRLIERAAPHWRSFTVAA